MYEVATKTHRGGRSAQEDRVFADAARGLFVVADGVGGRRGGDIAADLAVASLVRDCVGDPDRGRLRAVFLDLNRRMLEESALRGFDPPMGAVVTVAWLGPSGCGLIGHVGDARATMVGPDGAATQVTRDASAADLDGLSEAEAMQHPGRNVVARAVGAEPQWTATDWLDLHDIALRAGDRLVLCTDGVTDFVDRGRFARVGAKSTTAAELAEGLVWEALSGHAAVGRGDNIGVVVVRVPPPTRRARARATARALWDRQARNAAVATTIVASGAALCWASVPNLPANPHSSAFVPEAPSASDVREAALHLTPIEDVPVDDWWSVASGEILYLDDLPQAPAGIVLHPGATLSARRAGATGGAWILLLGPAPTETSRIPGSAATDEDFGVTHETCQRPE